MMPYRRKRATTKNATIRKIARSVVNRQIETKFYWKAVQLAFGYQTGVLTLLNDIPQNVGLQSRIGCKVHITGLRINGAFTVAAPTTAFNTSSCRFLVVMSTQALAPADVMTQVSFPQATNVYRTLHDESFTFDDTKRSVAINRYVKVNKIAKYQDATSSPENCYLYSFVLGYNSAGSTTIAGYTQLLGTQVYFKDA